MDARWAQLPDRASPLPEGAAHALSEDRGDRAAELRQARRPLLVASLARTRPALALPPLADDGAARPSARDRDGVAGYPSETSSRGSSVGRLPSTIALTSSPTRSTVPPITVRNAVSAASRPVAMRTSEERG